MSKIKILSAGFVWLFLLAGCAGSNQSAKTTEVKIYRGNVDTTGERTMRELCREVKDQVKWNPAPSGAQKNTEEEIFSKRSGPGMSEYSREYRESSRYSAAAADRDEMIQLCIQQE